jgi:hypothetical protein
MTQTLEKKVDKEKQTPAAMAFTVFEATIKVSKHF